MDLAKRRIQTPLCGIGQQMADGGGCSLTRTFMAVNAYGQVNLGTQRVTLDRLYDELSG